jgi:hypothetical protein
MRGLPPVLFCLPAVSCTDLQEPASKSAWEDTGGPGWDEGGYGHDGTYASEPACPETVVSAPPASLGLDPAYVQYSDVGGIPVVAMGTVDPAAFRVVRYVLSEMLAERPCVREAILQARIRIGIMGLEEVTTDMPEYSDLYEVFPDTDWDNRGRGFGATRVRPLTSVGEDNLLRLEGWSGESIMVHEFGHTWFQFGTVDQAEGDELEAELDTLYADAIAQGLWADTYAATNASEYWAEAVQGWFGTNLSADPPSGIHNHVDTREELEAYDPALHAFMSGLLPVHRDPFPYCDLSGEGPEWEDPMPPESAHGECAFAYQHIDDLGCGTLEGLRSESGDEAASLTVINRSAERTLVMDWVDYSGWRTEQARLPPRTSQRVGTYATHPFVVYDAAEPPGSCTSVFVPHAGSPSGAFHAILD